MLLQVELLSLIEKKRTSICLFSVVMNRAGTTQSVPPSYPTSSKKPKDWDKLEVEITKEEKDEKLEGDAALNKYI